jgi:hypothetical protein
VSLIDEYAAAHRDEIGGPARQREDRRGVGVACRRGARNVYPERREVSVFANLQRANP